MRLVDVVQRSVLQSLGKDVVFFLGDIAMGAIKQLEGAMKPAGIIQGGVDGRMIVEILAVIDGSFFDFVDGAVDGFDGEMVAWTDVLASEEKASGTQVRQRMEIAGMISRQIRRGIE